MKKNIIIGLITLLSFNVNASLNIGNSFEDENSPFKQGADYTVLNRTLTDTDKENVNVITFFSYGCKECVDTVKTMETWKKNMPYYSKMFLSPISPVVSLSDSHPARVYFSLEKLNRLDLNIPFLEMSVDGKTDYYNDKIYESWLNGRGISPENFKDAYNSNEVISQIYASPDIVEMYELNSIPTITIDGKYKIDAQVINKNKDNLTELVDYLVEKSAKESKIK